MTDLAPALPTQLGGYEILSELGRGGMGSVYLGRRSGPGGFNKFVAIKRVHPHLLQEKEFAAMFLDEARIAATIEHPNVAQVFELAQHGEEHLLVMEYLHGISLNDLLKSTKGESLPLAISLRIAAWAAEGLHAAHEAKDHMGNALGLIHRDVTPQNIFVTFDGRVKLTDFGVSKAEGRLVQTQSGWLKGKAAYMGPEQLQGDAIDRRLDVFSLGVVLWESLTARRLFRGESQAESMMAIVSGRTVVPSKYNDEIDESLDALVMKALATNREERFQSARELRTALESQLAKVPTPSGGLVGSTEVAEYIATLIPSLRAERDALLQTPASGELLRSGMVAGGVEAKSETHANPLEESSPDLPAATPSSGMTPPIPSRRRTMTLLILGGAAVAAALGVWAMSGGEPPPGDAPPDGPLLGVLRVDSQPAGARVFVDGDEVDERTPALIEDLAYGAHELRLELVGHHGASREVEIAQGRQDVNVPLRAFPAPTPAAEEDEEEDAGIEPPEATQNTTSEMAVAQMTMRQAAPTMMREDMAEAGTAFLNLITVPSVTVYIDGRSYGRTPMRRREIPAGRIVLELRPDEGESRRVPIQASVGETVAVPRVVLNP